jgi:hypothetical protein
VAQWEGWRRGWGDGAEGVGGGAGGAVDGVACGWNARCTSEDAKCAVSHRSKGKTSHPQTLLLGANATPSLDFSHTPPRSSPTAPLPSSTTNQSTNTVPSGLLSPGCRSAWREELNTRVSKRWDPSKRSHSMSRPSFPSVLANVPSQSPRKPPPSSRTNPIDKNTLKPNSSTHQRHQRLPRDSQSVIDGSFASGRGRYRGPGNKYRQGDEGGGVLSCVV